MRGARVRARRARLDRLGKNEKTKVVAKLQKPGGGAPRGEPVVSEDERKAMMAHYFKRQEEMKALAEANDDDYLTSAWADPKALKMVAHGHGRAARAPERARARRRRARARARRKAAAAA